MTIGQIVMYHSLGYEMKNGKADNKPTLKNMSYSQLKEYRDELKRQGLIDERAESNKKKEQYRAKYGAV
jgi:predicted transcriptional regulator